MSDSIYKVIEVVGSSPVFMGRSCKEGNRKGK